MLIKGDLWQLPPIYDSLVTDNNHLDGRPDCSPSHWNENFKIFYLTEKMRSQKDPNFSELCDRVGRGKISDDDEKYLQSRVLATESENSNENFKSGNLSIIVTTNLKKDFVNKHKLDQLLPNEKEYACNSIDRVTNLPSGRKLSNKVKENPGNTGNLQTVLKLKVGAPIVITSNHSKQKYREDGIVNGARGYVKAIQVSKDDQEKVEAVWIVFNNEDIGKLYRFEHKHLRQDFNPGHELATPILPVRKNFKLKFGSVEFQRTNFALSLAYAITAHKCQGETLNEVIIDFGPDKEHKIKNYICPGSFYVALTRVREGVKVFLRSFNKSYILVNKKIEEKVDAMIKHRSYVFKKIYLDHKIFEVDEYEIKAGYLNINGLQDGNHDLYLNADHNLSNLDILVLAETKLGKNCENESLKKNLDNWNILGRYDSDDEKKHMGLLLVSSKKSNILDQIQTITHQTARREGNLQIEGLIVRTKVGHIFGFVYCRSTPNQPEVKAICKAFGECTVLMGDFNLSHRITADQLKVKDLCQKTKVNALNEITRSISNNQLDYILIDNSLVTRCFVTSFNNFISDHKTITARIGLTGNQFDLEMKQKISFDRESHLKPKKLEEKELTSACNSLDDSDSSSSTINQSSDSNNEQMPNQIFRRKFKNIDTATCWLNSCLQLILTAMDHMVSTISLTSELGQELLNLQHRDQDTSLDPTQIKDILVTAEDTRIATRLSELPMEVDDQSELDNRSRAVQNLRLDLRSGQQCVRDFFICINENLINWPDVYSCFGFNITHSTTCVSCRHIHQSNTNQMYVEIPVPPDESSLNDYVEEYFNVNSLVGLHCENTCQSFVQVEKNSKLTLTKETEFFTVILTRAVETFNGFQLVKDRTMATDDVYIR